MARLLILFRTQREERPGVPSYDLLIQEGASGVEFGHTFHTLMFVLTFAQSKCSCCLDSAVLNSIAELFKSCL